MPHIIIIFSSVFAMTGYGCSSSRSGQEIPSAYTNWTMDPALEKQILSLTPEHVTEDNVREVLSRAPAPRIINLNGSLPLVTMDSFSKFLIAMGYPEQSVRSPLNGAYSLSSYTNSERLAGYVAWYYENEGLMPMLIGHSQGGMLVIKVLHELDGAFNDRLRVWNPLTGKQEERYSITDPLNGRERDVRSLKIEYASAVATGKLMRFFLGQWNMIGKLSKIPDTVEEFTGIRIRYDLIGSGLTEDDYYPTGSASVRNIILPASYSHINIPLTEHLAADQRTREWISAYVPRTDEPLPPEIFPEEKRRNILFAAEQWFYIKKHWCLALQKYVRSRQ